MDPISTLEEESNEDNNEKSHNHNSSSDKNESVSHDSADIIYDDPSLWRSDGSSFVDELSMLSSKLTKKYI